MTKIGPEVEQRANIDFAWMVEICLFSYRSPISLAPIGYPHKTLIKNTYAEIGGRLKSFFVVDAKNFEILSTTFNSVRSFDKNKNGSKDGTTA